MYMKSVEAIVYGRYSDSDAMSCLLNRYKIFTEITTSSPLFSTSSQFVIFQDKIPLVRLSAQTLLTLMSYIFDR